MPSSFSLFFPRPYLLVANLAQKGPVLRYELGSGDFVDSFIVVERPDPQFGSIYSLPYDVQIGPDGGVYVLVLNPREVWRYSPAGKFASAQNATTHGLAAKTLVLTNESRERFQTLFESYQDELDPQSQQGCLQAAGRRLAALFPRGQAQPGAERR